MNQKTVAWIRGVQEPEYRSWLFSTGAGAGPGVDIFD